MRISRPQMFMGIAEVAAQRSTCFRGNVGAVVVKDRDVLSMGYNGPVAGEPHCLGNDCEKTSSGGCMRSLHAEDNALNRASLKLGHSNLSDCDLYCTYSPCINCAQCLLMHRIRRFFYRYAYRVTDGIERLLDEPRLKIYQITPSGVIIERRTNMIIEADEL